MKEEVLEWYENKEKHPNEWMEDFVDLVMQKTTDAIIEEMKKELKNEFQNGNLRHNFIISPEYCLEIRLKGVKEKCVKESRVPREG